MFNNGSRTLRCRCLACVKFSLLKASEDLENFHSTGSPQENVGVQQGRVTPYEVGGSISGWYLRSQRR
jgi:hypothetical protein